MGDDISNNDSVVQGIVGMLRGCDDMLKSTDTWKEAELRKVRSKLAAVMASVDTRLEKIVNKPKKNMTYDALVDTIAQMIRCANPLPLHIKSVFLGGGRALTTPRPPTGKHRARSRSQRKRFSSTWRTRSGRRPSAARRRAKSGWPIRCARATLLTPTPTPCSARLLPSAQTLPSHAAWADRAQIVKIIMQEKEAGNYPEEEPEGFQGDDVSDDEVEVRAAHATPVPPIANLAQPLPVRFPCGLDPRHAHSGRASL